MSAWIKSHQSLRDHPKTRKLARRKGVGGIRGAVGLLHCLWWWCTDYSPDGDLTKHDPEDIAIGAEWDGEPEELLRHLTECGFIDANGDGHRRIHDWDQYGGALVEQRERNAERMRRARADSVQRTCTARAGLERKIDRKKELRAGGPVDNSTVQPAARSEDRICWRCNAPITGDDILDDKCVTSSRGIRHKECAP